MANMIEIKRTAIFRELEKLNSQLSRIESKVAKASAKAEKFGCMWTKAEYHEWRATIETDANGWIINKSDVDKNAAWFELFSACNELEDQRERITKAEIKLAKADEKVEAFREKVAAIEDCKRREEMRELEFAEEQKEWAKDGIILESRYSGKTPSGNAFEIFGNYKGYTTRHLHCYTLYINGKVIFTSGEFWRAYSEIKKR